MRVELMVDIERVKRGEWPMSLMFHDSWSGVFIRKCGPLTPKILGLKGVDE